MGWTAHIYGKSDDSYGESPAFLNAGVSLIELRGLAREVTKTVPMVVYNTDTPSVHNCR